MRCDVSERRQRPGLISVGCGALKHGRGLEGVPKRLATGRLTDIFGAYTWCGSRGVLLLL